jgi:hypothetical protein
VPQFLPTLPTDQAPPRGKPHKPPKRKPPHEHPPAVRV